MSSKILGILFAGIILVAFFLAAGAGLSNKEKSECKAWREEQTTNPRRLFAEWQYQQCEAQKLPLVK